MLFKTISVKLCLHNALRKCTSIQIILDLHLQGDRSCCVFFCLVFFNLFWWRQWIYIMQFIVKSAIKDSCSCWWVNINTSIIFSSPCILADNISFIWLGTHACWKARTDKLTALRSVWFYFEIAFFSYPFPHRLPAHVWSSAHLLFN